MRYLWPGRMVLTWGGRCEMRAKMFKYLLEEGFTVSNKLLIEVTMLKRGNHYLLIVQNEEILWKKS